MSLEKHNVLSHCIGEKQTWHHLFRNISSPWQGKFTIIKPLSIIDLQKLHNTIQTHTGTNAWTQQIFCHQVEDYKDNIILKGSIYILQIMLAWKIWMIKFHEQKSLFNKRLELVNKCSLVGKFLFSRLAPDWELESHMFGVTWLWRLELIHSWVVLALRDSIEFC